MKETKSIPVGIWLFAVVILLFILYYYISQLLYPLYTGEASFSRFLCWLYVILTIILLYAVTYGFYKAKNWARLYTIFYLSLSAFWAISMIILRWRIIERYIFFVIYVILIMYLLMSPVNAYFGKTNGPRLFHDRDRAYHYGEYTLYTKDVKLRSGRTQTIYFFSKRTLDTGRPCSKPDGYIIGVNQKTGMPYLKKKR